MKLLFLNVTNQILNVTEFQVVGETFTHILDEEQEKNLMFITQQS